MQIKHLGKVFAAFAAFEKTHQPLHFAQVFLVVAAADDGCTFDEIMSTLGLTNSAVSRTVMALGGTSRKQTPGYGLLTTQKDPLEGRRFLVKLTGSGKKLLRELQSI